LIPWLERADNILALQEVTKQDDEAWKSRLWRHIEEMKAEYDTLWRPLEDQLSARGRVLLQRLREQPGEGFIGYIFGKQVYMTIP